jgi:phosphohistidine phosphatase SixA
MKRKVYDLPENQGFRGKITDRTSGAGVAGAKVYFYGIITARSTIPPEERIIEESVESDFQGNYLKGLPPGHYKIWVEHPSFDKFRSRIKLLPINEFSTINISLRRNPVTTVYVIRHAEYTPGPQDPSLNQTGRDRAEQLLRVLYKAKVDAIFCTQWTRTKETAQPLATKNNIAPITYQDTDISGLMQQIRSETYRGKNLLVIGHSNTVPSIIRELIPGCPVIWQDVANYHHDLFIVTFRNPELRDVKHLRYGEIPACT